MIDDIYTRTPINKTAALVTSDSGFTNHQSLTDIRKSLITAKDSLQKRLDSLPKNDPEAQLIGLTIRGIQQDLSLLKKQKKFVGLRDRDLNEYIVSVIKEDIPPYKFKEYLSRARALKEKEMQSFLGEE